MWTKIFVLWLKQFLPALGSLDGKTNSSMLTTLFACPLTCQPSASRWTTPQRRVTIVSQHAILSRKNTWKKTISLNSVPTYPAPPSADSAEMSNRWSNSGTA